MKEEETARIAKIYGGLFLAGMVALGAYKLMMWGYHRVTSEGVHFSVLFDLSGNQWGSPTSLEPEPSVVLLINDVPMERRLSDGRVFGRRLFTADELAAHHFDPQLLDDGPGWPPQGTESESSPTLEVSKDTSLDLRVKRLIEGKSVYVVYLHYVVAGTETRGAFRVEVLHKPDGDPMRYRGRSLELGRKGSIEDAGKASAQAVVHFSK